MILLHPSLDLFCFSERPSADDHFYTWGQFHHHFTSINVVAAFFFATQITKTNCE